MELKDKVREIITVVRICHNEPNVVDVATDRIMQVVKEDKGKVLTGIMAKRDAAEEMYEACKAIVRDFEDEDEPLIIPASSCVHVPNHTDLCPYWLAKQALAKVEGRR